jgi:3-oxoacyl-[acyl-carrier-protein] synthase II
MLKWYKLCESMMDATTTVARFKHLCGEYPTASAFGLWLACNLPVVLPGHLVKTQPEKKKFQKILIYNNYKSDQHSFILLDRLL